MSSEQPSAEVSASVDTDGGLEAGGGSVEIARPVPASSVYLLKDPNLKEILLSDSGTDALLARLKQSLFSCKEFAVFIKKIATIENEHSQHLKKAARVVAESFKRPENKTGTFQTQVLDIVKTTDRVGDAGNNFIDSMHRIHDELQELARTIDRQRKVAKETALRHEKNLLDAESLADKAKSKYDLSCEELEKARHSEAGKNKLGFKNKSEDELHKKMTIAEVDYQNKVDAVQRLRRELTAKLRVDTVNTLQNLILECDQALSLQVLRYANLCEALQLNRGFVIAPIKPKNSPTANLTVKEMACKIDAELDFYNYVLAIPRAKKTLNRQPVAFRKHPSQGRSAPPAASLGAPTGQGLSGPSPLGGPAAGPSASGYPDRSFSGPSFAKAPPPQPQPQASRDRHASAASTASAPSHIVASGTAKTGPILAGSVGPAGSAKTGPVLKPGGARPLDSAAPGVAPTSINTPTALNMPFEGAPGAGGLGGAGAASGLGGAGLGGASGASGASGAGTAASAAAAGAAGAGTGGSMTVYGTALEELLDFEEGTVPRVVYQCVQAIDNFGLEVEGIYRTNGAASQVDEIKREFDNDSAAVDLLRPNAVVNDIHSVASALKQYFRELPDPLLTREFHREFLNAANIQDDIRRRDTIHAIINKLPDANYTTLRYLIFHLYRVQEREAINRMNVTNLGIVWGPTLMATDYSHVGEMAMEGRVVDTVLVNAYAIFEAE